MKTLKALKKEKGWWFNYLNQSIACLAILFYLIWFICDMVFISKGLTLVGEWVLDWELVWDQHWYNVSLGLNITLLAIVGMAMMSNLSHLVATAFKFKKDKGQAIYKIIVDLCIIGCAMAFICGVPSYISKNIFVFDTQSRSIVSHMDVINLTTIGFIAAAFSFIMHWKKNKVFGLQAIEKDFKWVVRITAFAAIAFMPFFIWKVLPVQFFNEDLTQDWSNIIAECITIPMQLLNAVTFIAFFGLFILYLYQHTQLGGKEMNNIIVSCFFWFAIMGLFIVNHAIDLDFSKLIDYEQEKLVWKPIFALNFVQVILTAIGGCATFFRHKPANTKKITEIYQDEIN